MTLTARPGLNILRHGPQLILPAILVQQVLAIAIAHLSHVRSLAEIVDVAIDARVAGGVASTAAHETVGNGEADEDREAGADDDEEGHQDAVHGGRLVGCLAGHWESVSEGGEGGVVVWDGLTFCCFE